MARRRVRTADESPASRSQFSSVSRDTNTPPATWATSTLSLKPSRRRKPSSRRTRFGRSRHLSYHRTIEPNVAAFPPTFSARTTFRACSPRPFAVTSPRSPRRYPAFVRAWIKFYLSTPPPPRAILNPSVQSRVARRESTRRIGLASRSLPIQTSSQLPRKSTCPRSLETRPW